MRGEKFYESLIIYLPKRRKGHASEKQGAKNHILEFIYYQKNCKECRII